MSEETAHDAVERIRKLAWLYLGERERAERERDAALAREAKLRSVLTEVAEAIRRVQPDTPAHQPAEPGGEQKYPSGVTVHCSEQPPTAWASTSGTPPPVSDEERERAGRAVVESMNNESWYVVFRDRLRCETYLLVDGSWWNPRHAADGGRWPGYFPTREAAEAALAAERKRCGVPATAAPPVDSRVAWTSRSQVQGIGEGPPQSWDDYERGCLSTFGGGRQEDEEWSDLEKHDMTSERLKAVAEHLLATGQAHTSSPSELAKGAFAANDRVVKNPATWQASDFDRWGAGEGVGVVLEVDGDCVDVRWAGGRAMQSAAELLPFAALEAGIRAP